MLGQRWNGTSQIFVIDNSSFKPQQIQKPSWPCYAKAWTLCPIWAQFYLFKDSLPSAGFLPFKLVQEPKWKEEPEVEL